MIHTIIGINGTTGLEIAKELRTRQIAVRGISRRPFAGDWQHVCADVLDAAALKNAVAGSAVVYACFGMEYNIKVWQRDWVVAIENVIESCRATNAKLVFLDNVYMYGYVNGTMTENTPMNPTSEKGKVRKAVAEKILQAFAQGGLKGCIARAPDFYGPNCPNSMFTDTGIKNALKGSSMQWLGRLEKKHAYIYTPDIGRACVNLGLSDMADGQVWHLPTAPMQTNQFFVNKIAQLTNTKPKAMPLRGFMLTVLGWFVPVLKEIKEMMYQYDEDYDFSSAKYEAAFNDRPTSYEVGLTETVNWYKNNA
jgi:nucleoside-diphosphate-sugar epimerase